jgi:hypothetical protein
MVEVDLNPKYVNFLEFDSLFEANNVDLHKFTFLERFSATRGKYCFKIKVSRLEAEDNGKDKVQ